MAFLKLFGRNRYRRAGYELYTQAVRAARDPHFYATLGVPDTMDGRFDMIGLFVFLVIRRLQDEPKPGPELAQAVFDAMFSDMDMNLRELGVSDMRVGKRVRDMWEALNGRSAAYAAALDAGDRVALAKAIGRNVWREDAPDGSGPHHGALALAEVVSQQSQALATQPTASLLAGHVDFMPTAAAAA